eukprot:4145042-Amphidinium_carterae.1
MQRQTCVLVAIQNDGTWFALLPASSAVQELSAFIAALVHIVHPLLVGLECPFAKLTRSCCQSSGLAYYFICWCFKHEAELIKYSINNNNYIT